MVRRHRRQLSPRASNAERYSLMRKLTVTEPEADTLELCFDMTGKEGAGCCDAIADKAAPGVGVPGLHIWH
ncbi:g1339 [Coccomyxa viridis]|uniref:G1339 protein n=1 Tax=Coccomyxa viridis TaxID=1274662 RepID=A0ABP1FPK2_9CHLO